MNKFVKSLLAIGVTTALTTGFVNAATYKVIDKGAAERFKYTYAQQENNSGEMAISGTNVYNFPVQYQYFDEGDYDNIVRLADQQHENVHELENIQDENALRQGNPTANDLAWVVRYLEGITSSLYQKVGDVVAMTNSGGETQDFHVFDQKLAGTELYTRSTTDYINGITNQGWVYGNGSAPYMPMDFTESDGDEVTHWVRDFKTRGFFSPDNGQTIIELLPPEHEHGGESAILDISENGIAVGYASTSVDQDAVDVINDDTGGCSDPNVLDDLPLEVCIQNIRDGMYNSEAFKWIIDETGEVESEALGYLVTPHADDRREYVSFAQAVNVHGVAVGYAHGWWDENETSPENNEPRSIYAVVFKDGTVVDYTDDHSKYFDSRAYDINDNGIAVGHVTTYVNGRLRTKFYYVDTNQENMQMVFPKDFFNGSSSTARSINQAGFVVGEGEIETHNDSSTNPRRTHGFLYDMSTDTFTNLNDFLPCESEYTIIEARHINDNNEISATALIKVPRRDAKGELMLDTDGTQLQEDVVRAVKLSPIDGEVEDCSAVEEKVERQGAGFGFGLLLSMLTFGFGRRFLKA
ncbi:DUF3466 family protein [Thalassotalea fusca]